MEEVVAVLGRCKLDDTDSQICGQVNSALHQLHRFSSDIRIPASHGKTPSALKYMDMIVSNGSKKSARSVHPLVDGDFKETKGKIRCSLKPLSSREGIRQRLFVDA